MTTASNHGRLYGVGVGPGDPELLTVKAQRVLQSVPVIWVPQAGVKPGELRLQHRSSI